MKVSLKTKIIIFIDVLLFVVIFLFGTFSYNIARKSLKATVSKTMSSLADQFATQIYDLNDKEFLILERMAKLKEIRQTGEGNSIEKNAFLTSSIEGNDQYIRMVYIDTKGKLVIDEDNILDVSQEEYFKKAVKGSRYVSAPMYRADINEFHTYYAVPVYDDSHVLTGVLVSAKKGDILSEFAKNIDLGQGYTPAVMDRSTGETIGNNNKAQEDGGSNQSDLDPSSPFFKLIGRVMAGETAVEDFIDPFTHEHQVVSYKPVGDYCSWSVFCAAPYDFYYGSIKQLKSLSIAIGIASMIICYILTSIFMSRIIDPLKNLKENIMEIASGKADLTKRINVQSHDEIGDVVEGFNLFSGKLQDIVKNIKDSKVNLNQTGVDLETSAEDTSVSITQIINEMKGVREQINIQSSSVSQTAGAVNQITSNIESLENMVTNQASGVSEASAAVEQMIGNIKSVNNSVDQMFLSFKDLSSKAVAGSDLQNDVNQKIETIKNQSETLQEANLAIANIAEQTNLLAMNAAIEAAHAGESGKGFSVVADEIRKLSETSSSQSKTIGEQLNSMMESIEAVVESSKKSSESFFTVTSQLEQTTQLVEHIKYAMEEQDTGSKQINDVLHKMNNETIEVRTASKEMTEGNSLILDEIKTLKSATSSMLASMEQMNAGVNKINETGSALTDITERVKNNIKQIGNYIDTFEV